MPVSSPAASVPDAHARQASRRRVRRPARRPRHRRDARRQGRPSRRPRPHWGFGCPTSPDHRSAADRGLRLPSGHDIHPQTDRLQPGRPDGSHAAVGGDAGTQRRLRRVAADLRGRPVDPAGIRRRQEYCTHGTVRDGRLQVYGCCESSAFQVNYAHVDKPEIRRWVEHFVSALRLTGRCPSTSSSPTTGAIHAIECNPRTHSAITMFHDHPRLAAAYLDDGHPVITPRHDARPTYWLYHELWRLLTQSDRRQRIATHPARHGRHLQLVGSVAVLHGSSSPDSVVARGQPARAPWLDTNRFQHRQTGRERWRLTCGVLQLVGSPVDDFHADLSRLYAGGCLRALGDALRDGDRRTSPQADRGGFLRRCNRRRSRTPRCCPWLRPSNTFRARASRR